MAFNHSISDPLERIKDFMKYHFNDTADEYWDSRLHAHIRAISASSTPSAGTTTSTYSVGPIPSTLCNRMRNLHGGCAATLLDIITTIAIAPLSRPNAFNYAGVSRTLNCSYLRPVKEGMTVKVVCEVVGLGKRLVAVTGRVEDEGGKVLVTCEHHKVSVDPPPSVWEGESEVGKAKL